VDPRGPVSLDRLFFLIEAGDLNDALRMASKFPAARLGCIEVRQVSTIVVILQRVLGIKIG
jgi:hypothetical protein